jgi:N6-L-threonylcarbamoyladenine synthase
MTHADRVRPGSTAPPGLLPPSVERKVDFSFSGLKTAVLRLVEEIGGRRTGDGQPLNPAVVADIAASFQRVVVESLLDRTFEAAKWLGARSVGISGGVSANSRLRADAEARGRARRAPGVRPAALPVHRQRRDDRRRGFRRLRAGVTADFDLNALASLPL